jgi:hypothetical protein
MPRGSAPQIPTEAVRVTSRIIGRNRLSEVNLHRHRRPHRLICGIAPLCSLIAAVAVGVATAQTPLPTPLLRASANGELPLPAWGPYAPQHVGPACLVNRLLLQQFVFPIVISQQRDEIQVQATRAQDGKFSVHREEVTLLRRMMGLSPAQADDDDRKTAGTPPMSRRALLTEADREGLYWRAHIEFARAGVTQAIGQLPDATGKLQPPPDWGEGEADVAYFPAFGDTGGDGLLIRIALTNRSETRQTFCVDLLGGMNTQTEDFLPHDLNLLTDAHFEGIAVQHPKCGAVFALAANPAPQPLRAYRVDNSYFSSGANINRRDAAGALLPAGMLPIVREKTSRDRQSAQVAVDHLPTQSETDWGLVRLSPVVVAAGETVTLYFSVGVGKDAEAARASAQTLLGIAEDATPNGTLREGAYTLAQKAHRNAMLVSDDAGINSLIAQTLGNAPLTGGRRIGVPSRQPNPGRLPRGYQPDLGGMIALGYDAIEPTFAAAELNAWFQTNRDPDTARTNPTAAPPTNLFALWELLQTTRDRELLQRIYPHARRRYLELTAPGKNAGDDRAFGWPAHTAADLFIPALMGATVQPELNAGTPSPDYIAYMIRSARLLRSMATQAMRPTVEIQAYTDDIEQATRYLNERLWDANRGLYAPAKPLAADTVADLLPLIAGAETITLERRKALLKSLTDPAEFWSPAGIRQVSKTSPTYRADSPYGGAVHIGVNWLLWKGLLDLGEAETAARLAANLLHAYRTAQSACHGCPEWLDGDTGAPGGALDYSGDACALIPIYAAYHLPGTVTTGWNIQLLDRQYDGKADNLRFAFRSLEAAQSGALICALGKPNGRYRLVGTISGEVTADANGAVTLHAPRDGTTQQIELTPIAGTTQ